MRFLALLGALSALLSAIPAEACLVASPKTTPAAPIIISKDADFLSNPAVSGGSGSPEDPYRIENLNLSIGDQTAIRVSGTYASFLIRNVTISSARAPGTRAQTCCYPAISLHNLAHGRVEGAHLQGLQSGIAVTSATFVSIVGNSIEGGAGIGLGSSRHVTVSGNRLTGSSFSLAADTPEEAGSHVISEDNLIDGVPVFYRGDCNGVAAADRVLATVIIGNCTHVALDNLTIPGPRGTLNVLFASDVSIDSVSAGDLTFADISHAAVRNSKIGRTTLQDFDDFVIESSETAPNATTWIMAFNGSGLRIEGNSFHGNSDLLILGGIPRPWCGCYWPPPPSAVSGAVVANNTFDGWGGTAIYLPEAPGSWIHGNRIVNYSYAVNANTQPSVLIENNWLVADGGDMGIGASGEGAVVRNNSLAGYYQGVGAGPGVEVSDNEITASTMGIRLGTSGGPLVTGNRLQGGAIVIPTQGNYPAYNFSIGPNNTVNGLPVAFHRGCDGLTYNGTALGQLIVVNCSNVSLSNLVFKDVSAPLQLVGLEALSIDNVTVENASLGVSLEDVYLGTVVSSHFNGSDGFELDGAMNVTFEGNVFESEQATLSISSAAGITLTNNTIRGGARGALQASATFEMDLRGNQFTNGGIVFWGSSAEEYASHRVDETNTVDGRPILYLRDLQGGRIENRSVGELILVNSTDVTITNVDAESGGPAVSLAWDSGVRLSNVTARSSRAVGLFVVSTERLEVVDSHLGLKPDLNEEGWWSAASLFDVDNVTFLRSELNGTNGTALYFSEGSGLAIIDSSIVAGSVGAQLRTVKGIEVNHTRFSGGSPQFNAFDVSRVTLANSQFRGGGGVWLSGARGVSILNSDFEDLQYGGISVHDASDVLVRGNQVRGSLSGIGLGEDLTNVTVEANILKGNGVGLDLETQSTTGVTVRDNTLEGNDVGVHGNASAGVQIYHNRFLNNTVQALVSPGALWDAGYLVGGNFWSDYRGTDACSGPNQDVCPDPDQFGDTPYCLGAPSGLSEAVDRYPLMNQTPPPPRDPPPYVPPQPAPPVPGVLDPTAAGLTGVALLLGVVGTGTLLAAHLRARRKDEAEDEMGERGKP